MLAVAPGVLELKGGDRVPAQRARLYLPFAPNGSNRWGNKCVAPVARESEMAGTIASSTLIGKQHVSFAFASEGQ